MFAKGPSEGSLDRRSAFGDKRPSERRSVKDEGGLKLLFS